MIDFKYTKKTIPDLEKLVDDKTETLKIGRSEFTILSEIKVKQNFKLFVAVHQDKKYLIKSFMCKSDEEFEELVNVHLFQREFLKCKKIVRLHRIFANKQQKKILILIQNLDCNLKEYLNNLNKSLQTEDIVKIVVSVAEALNFMHSRESKVLHRDIKPENVFLYKKKHWKLGNFRSATDKVLYVMTDKERANVVDEINKFTTSIHRSPEMIDTYRSDVIDHKSDIWALGCLLFYISTLSEPFSDEDTDSILKGEPSWPCGNDVNPNIKSLIDVCFICDQNKRPSARVFLGICYVLFPHIVDEKWKYEFSEEEIKTYDTLGIGFNTMRTSIFHEFLPHLTQCYSDDKAQPLDGGLLNAVVAKKDGRKYIPICKASSTLNAITHKLKSCLLFKIRKPAADSSSDTTDSAFSHANFDSSAREFFAETESEEVNNTGVEMQELSPSNFNKGEEKIPHKNESETADPFDCSNKEVLYMNNDPISDSGSDNKDDRDPFAYLDNANCEKDDNPFK